MALNTSRFTSGDLAAASNDSLRGQKEAQHSTQSSMGILGGIARFFSVLFSPIKSAIEVIFGSLDKSVVVDSKRGVKACSAGFLGREVHLSKKAVVKLNINKLEIGKILRSNNAPKKTFEEIYKLLGKTDREITDKLDGKSDEQVHSHLNQLRRTLYGNQYTSIIHGSLSSQKSSAINLIDKAQTAAG